MQKRTCFTYNISISGRRRFLLTFSKLLRLLEPNPDGACQVNRPQEQFVQDRRYIVDTTREGLTTRPLNQPDQSLRHSFPTDLTKRAGNAIPPPARMVSASFSNRSIRLAARTTVAPAKANSSAATSPIPENAPVTIATLPAMDGLIFTFNKISFSHLI